MTHVIRPEFFTNCWPKNYYAYDIRRMSSLYSKCIIKPFENPEKHADSLREQILQNPVEYLEDASDDDYIYVAEDYAVREYGLIKDMQYRTKVLWICCIFEIWEQNMSRHILQDLCNADFPMTEAQKNNLFNGFNTFKAIFSGEMFGGTESKCILSDFPRYKELRELHILVNALKHGRGSSLNRLYSDYPRYKIGGQGIFQVFEGTTIYTPTLNITDDDFYRFCNVLIDFWKWIPSHIIITNIEAFKEKVLNRSRGSGEQNEI